MMSDNIESRAKEMAAENGWFWFSLGETGLLGREGWRKRAQLEFESNLAQEPNEL